MWQQQHEHSSGGGTISVVMASYSPKTQPYWTTLVSGFEKKPKIHANLRVIDWNTLLRQVTMIQTGSYPDMPNFNTSKTFASSGCPMPSAARLSRSWHRPCHRGEIE